MGAGAVNHCTGQARNADAEVGAVARHDGDQRAALDLLRRLEHRLAGGHREVEEEVVVAVDEAQNLLRPGLWSSPRSAPARLAHEERGGGAVAVVAPRRPCAAPAR